MRDLKTEQYLELGKYAWDYNEKIPISAIDKKKSKTNPSRAAYRIDDERVLQYAIAKESGTDFPAVVLLRMDGIPSGNPDLLVITGMHRIAAFELAGAQEVDAYIVNELDEYRVDALLYSINNIEGRAPTQTEQILKILTLHEKYPHISLAQLAKEWNIKKEAVTSVARVQRIKLRARDAGYDLDRMKIGAEGVKALGTIYDDAVFMRACTFVNNHAPTTAQIQDLCKQIREAPREQRAGLEIIRKAIEEAEFRQREQRVRIGRTPQGRAEKYQSLCKSLLKKTEQGLEHLHLSSLSRPGDLKLIWEALIATGKRVILECERLEYARSRQKSVQGHSVPIQPNV